MFDYYTIEPQVDEYTGKKYFTVYGHGEYEKWSVLAGQYRKACVDHFDTVEEAQAAYPDAEYGSTMKASAVMPDVPWEGFDELDAGETW